MIVCSRLNHTYTAPSTVYKPLEVITMLSLRSWLEGRGQRPLRHLTSSPGLHDSGPTVLSIQKIDHTNSLENECGTLETLHDIYE